MKNTLEKIQNNHIFQLSHTLSKLGVVSLYRYAVHRVLMSSGRIKKLTPISNFIHRPSYSIKSGLRVELEEQLSPFFSNKVEEFLSGNFRLFFHMPVPLSSWKKWCFYDEEVSNKHWSISPINNVAGHDIKLTWDLSRFHWLIESSLAFRYTGNLKLLSMIQKLLDSWCEDNPKNVGVNWVCAQECSIRMFHLIISYELLSPVCNQNKKFVLEFVVASLQRIDASLNYSISQDNNHGVTESAALYIGAIFLKNNGRGFVSDKLIGKWYKKGRKFLRNRLDKLIFQDGGFAMYSSNYHRSVLNLLTIVKVFEMRYVDNGIGFALDSQARNMITWLESLSDITTGEFPNLGTNDGSSPFLPQLSDFRTSKDSLDAANFVFNNVKKFDTSHELYFFLKALGVKGEPRKVILKPYSRNFNQSGLMHLTDAHNDLNVFIKYPVYKYRPAQSDLLHVDIWLGGINVAKDLGTYSYNCCSKNDYYNQLSSISSHNTIQFENYDGMPKLSVFLYSNWASTFFQRFTKSYWQGAYNTYFGSYHERKVSIINSQVIIEDKTDSDCDFATLRWHVKGGDWKTDGRSVSSKEYGISIVSNKDLKISLSTVQESRYYGKLEPLTCIEVLFNPKEASLSTTFRRM